MPGLTPLHHRTLFSALHALVPQMADKNRAISTGKRMASASDDPAAWAATSALSRTLERMEAAKSNLTAARAIGELAHSELNAIQLDLTRARELLVQAGSNLLGPNDRQALAAELTSMAEAARNAAVRYPKAEALIVDGLPLTPAPHAADIFGPALSDGGAAGPPLDQLFEAASDAIANGTALADISRSIDDKAAHLNVLTARQGRILQSIDNQQNRIADKELSLAAHRSALADTDLAATIAALQQQMVQHEAAQASFTRLTARSLFDHLR